MRSTPLFLACVLALCGGAGGSAAQDLPQGTLVYVAVSSKGLDLSTEKGAERFLRRLARASSRACGGSARHSALNFYTGRELRRCRAEALGRVVTRSQSRLLKKQFAATREARIVRLVER